MLSYVALDEEIGIEDVVVDDSDDDVVDVADGIVCSNCSCCILKLISMNTNHEQDIFRLLLFRL